MMMMGKGSRRIAPPPVVGPPTLTKVGYTDLFASGTTLSNASVDIGDADANRLVIITAAGVKFGRSTVGVTINGDPADIHFDVSAAGDQEVWVMCFSKVVPTGTTAEVIVNMNDTMFGGFNAFVYTVDVTDLISATPSVGTAFTSADTSLTTSAYTETVDGFVLAVARGPGGGGGATSMIITDLTVDDPFAPEAGARLSSIAPIVSTNPSATAHCEWTGTENVAFAAAAFR